VKKKLSRKEEEELRRKRVYRTADFMADRVAARSVSSDRRGPPPPRAIVDHFKDSGPAVQRAFAEGRYDMRTLHSTIGNTAIARILETDEDRAYRERNDPTDAIYRKILGEDYATRIAEREAAEGLPQGEAPATAPAAPQELAEPQAAESGGAGGDRVTVRDPQAGLDITYDLDGGGAPDVNLTQVKEQMGSGHPLDENTRRYMEWRFQVNFGRVRLHTGPKADALSRALFAKAFALGAEVAFQGGSYRPGTKEGDRLLAHELTHVVQAGLAPRIEAPDAAQDAGALPSSALPAIRDFAPLPPSVTSITRIGESLRGLAKSGSVSEPTDAIEIEADRMADEVVSVSRGEFQAAMRDLVPGAEEEDETKKAGRQQASELVKRALAAGGQELPEALRERLEQALGAELAGVRIHSDESASEAATALSARAFTVGTDIVFGSGEYEPGTLAGEELIAHEVTHVAQHLQGRAGQATGHEGDVPVTTAGDAVEREAEQVAGEFSSGRSPQPARATPKPESSSHGSATVMRSGASWGLFKERDAVYDAVYQGVIVASATGVAEALELLEAMSGTKRKASLDGLGAAGRVALFNYAPDSVSPTLLQDLLRRVESSETSKLISNLSDSQRDALAGEVSNGVGSGLDDRDLQILGELGPLKDYLGDKTVDMKTALAIVRQERGSFFENFARGVLPNVAEGALTATESSAPTMANTVGAAFVVGFETVQGLTVLKDELVFWSGVTLKAGAVVSLEATTSKGMAPLPTEGKSLQLEVDLPVQVASIKGLGIGLESKVTLAGDDSSRISATGPSVAGFSQDGLSAGKGAAIATVKLRHDHRQPWKMGPIQLKESQRQESARDESGEDRQDIVETAERGFAGGGGKLPHLDSIQESFGSHDISGIKASVGGPAKAASEAIGAEAYASGDKVAFKGSPDLHTAAHEAAHVVQQRGGVSLKGSVGKAGDRYEQHADAVADAVVAGKSAEALLDPFAGGTPGLQQKAVQRKANPITDVEQILPEGLSLEELQFIEKAAHDFGYEAEWQEKLISKAVIAGESPFEGLDTPVATIEDAPGTDNASEHGYLYPETKKAAKEGYTNIQSYSNENFYMDVLTGEGVKPIIVIRGSDDLEDFAEDDLDITGIGKSEFEENKAAIKQQLERVNEEFPDQKVIVAGHSLGGTMAAYTQAEFPDLVDIRLGFQDPAVDFGTALKLSAQIADGSGESLSLLAAGDPVKYAGGPMRPGASYVVETGTSGVESHQAELTPTLEEQAATGGVKEFRQFGMKNLAVEGVRKYLAIKMIGLRARAKAVKWLGKIVEKSKDTFDGASKWLIKQGKGFANWTANTAKAAGAFFKHTVEKAKETAVAQWSELKSSTSKVFDTVTEQVKSMASDAKDAIGGAVNTLGQAALTAKNWIGEQVDNATQWAKKTATVAKDTVVGTLNIVGGWLADKAEDVKNWVAPNKSAAPKAQAAAPSTSAASTVHSQASAGQSAGTSKAPAPKPAAPKPASKSPSVYSSIADKYKKMAGSGKG
jgi:hypothetical protein